MHLGRAGLKYRAIDTTDGWIWDLYADAQLGGISEMSGAYKETGFDYDNYSNGRWGFHVGTQVGKAWSNFSMAGFVEALRTFGNDNNSIDVTQYKVGGVLPVTKLGLPDEISVDLKSTTEINAGLKMFYQLNDRWSFGGGLTFKHHSDNGVEGLASKVGSVAADAQQTAAVIALKMKGVTDPSVIAGMLTAEMIPVYATGLQQSVINGLLDKVEDMEDGFDEYVLNLTAAYQMTDTTQVAVYGEYTFDDAHAESQNGTDVKAELGVRLNVQF
jgi:long-subunit fatty acid transport protein